MTATLERPRPDADDGRDVASRARSHRALVVTYSVTGAVGSALLFLVEPLMVRQLLPLLGGSAAVWNTAMVFFQIALLCGYLVAHVAGTRRGPVGRVGVLAVLALGLVALPLALPEWSPPSTGGQAWWVLGVMAVSVGLPFVGLASLSPTLQRWFADTDHPRAADPYFLYAAGNVGSVVGLVAYPIVVEPALGLADQRRWWSLAYALTIVLVVACLLLRRRHAAPAPSSNVVQNGGHDPRSAQHFGGGREIVRWVVLAAVPSGLLLGVTRHLSTDVAAVPLLWVLPLLAYLATFVVAFRRGTAPTEGVLRAALIVSIPLVATLVSGVGSAVVGIAIGLVGFTLLAFVCHARLASVRPDHRWLTTYYLWVSFGGAIGGIGVALVAPVVFTRVTEYPLLVMAALAVVVAAAPVHERSRRLDAVVGAVVAVVAVVCVALSGAGPENGALVTQALGVGAGIVYVVARSPRRIAVALAALTLVTVAVDERPALYESRTFFGVNRVRLDDAGRHVFEHGTTIHGAQDVTPRPTTEPLTYYRADSGVGRTLTALRRDPEPLQVGVVGLGAGTLASYGRPGDRIDFYEIDAEVVRIARDPSLFSFIERSSATVTTAVGDGRMLLTASERRYNLIVLDAFSSDAIPVHLLTAEAFAAYRDHLTDDGVVAVHISNRFFDLAPIVARVGAETGFDSHQLTTSISSWMLLSRDGAPTSIEAELRRTGDNGSWRRIEAGPSVPLWTDDFSNLLSALE